MKIPGLAFQAKTESSIRHPGGSRGPETFLDSGFPRDDEKPPAPHFHVELESPRKRFSGKNRNPERFPGFPLSVFTGTSFAGTTSVENPNDQERFVPV